MDTAFNAEKTEHCSVTGALAAGETLRLRLVVPRSFGVSACTLLLTPDGEETRSLPFSWESTNGTDEWWGVSITPPAGLYFYHFSFETSWGVTVLHRQPGSFSAGVDGDERWQLTVYPPESRTPEGIRGGILYQIFPDRFFDSGEQKTGVPADRRMHTDQTDLPDYRPDSEGCYRNDDYFGGDLAGIREKLPYLKSLGVTALYLNPIAEAHSNHRYNTADYKKVDPLLGGEADFKDLCAAAHRLSIRVLIDGVYSHTGDDSVYFNKYGRYPSLGAYQSDASPYRSWYTFGETRDEYACWWNIDTLPEVNENDPGFTEFITGEEGVIARWLSLGADGVRLDVADELPDAFLDRVRAAVKRGDEERWLIGEVWEDASNKISHGGRRRYFDGRQLDGVMNYPFRDAVLRLTLTGDAPGFMHAVLSVVRHYPPQNLHVGMNLLGTHDTPRLLTVLAGYDAERLSREAAAAITYTPEALSRAKRLLRFAVTVNYFLPGVPSIYYGDEAGMTGGRDPLNRAFFPWGREDAALVDFYRRLGSLRLSQPVLKSGGFYPLSAALGCAAFLRYEPGLPRVAVIANRNPEPIHYVLNADMRGMACAMGGERTPEGVWVPAETAAVLTDA